MLDVRRLRLLREVQVRGTIAAAAEALNFTPSAVSQQLSLLEQETGVELLRRVGRRVQLTPQAEILARFSAGMADRFFGDWKANEVELIHSELSSGGARYTTLAAFPLLGN